MEGGLEILADEELDSGAGTQSDSSTWKGVAASHSSLEPRRHLQSRITRRHKMLTIFEQLPSQPHLVVDNPT
jgi:hypothetical protein